MARRPTLSFACAASAFRGGGPRLLANAALAFAVLVSVLAGAYEVGLIVGGDA